MSIINQPFSWRRDPFKKDVDHTLKQLLAFPLLASGQIHSTSHRPPESTARHTDLHTEGLSTSVHGISGSRKI